MAYNSFNDDLQFIGRVIDTKIDEQSRFRKFSNTVTALVGALVTIASQALLLPFGLPDSVMWLVLVITMLGTVFGVNNTKNGFSPSQVEKMRKWQAEYIDRQHEATSHAVPVTGGYDAYEAPETYPEAFGQAVDGGVSMPTTAEEIEEEVRKFNAKR